MASFVFEILTKNGTLPSADVVFTEQEVLR